MEQTHFASQSQSGLNLLLIKRGKKTTPGNQNKPYRNIWLEKFQVKVDYFLPERFDICEEIFNGVLKCFPVVGFKCRGLSNI